MEKVDTLKDFTKIVVETDEKNPATRLKSDGKW